MLEETAPSNWPDDSVESAFRAEARERGEPMVAPVAEHDVTEPMETTALPALNDLVGRLPAEVRDVLDDLFRAKFVAVKRVPKKSLKG